jgi:peptidoglycan/xylan/chitin deacetylase (PgdA/CDA1 family)
VPFKRFASQLQGFIDAGWTFVSLAQIQAFIKDNLALPAKCVHVSFDDGYKATLTVAHPWLKAHHIPYSIFPYVTMIESGKKSALTWTDLQTMIADGVEIGCHSWDHPILTKPGKTLLADPEAYAAWLRKETAEAKAVMEEKLGIAIRSYAFPFGMADTPSLAAIKAAGFVMAFNILGGDNCAETDPFGLYRILVTPQTPPHALLNAATIHPLPIRILAPTLFDIFPPGPVRFKVEIDPLEAGSFSALSLWAITGPLGHVKLGEFSPQGNNIFELEADLAKPGWYLLRIQGLDKGGNQAVAMMLGKRPS